MVHLRDNISKNEKILERNLRTAFTMKHGIVSFHIVWNVIISSERMLPSGHEIVKDTAHGEDVARVLPTCPLKLIRTSHQLERFRWHVMQCSVDSALRIRPLKAGFFA